MEDWLNHILSFIPGGPYTVSPILGTIILRLGWEWYKSRSGARKRGLTVEVVERGIVAEFFEDTPLRMTDLDGNKILNAYHVAIRFWNKGRLEVRMADISPKFPLTVKLGEDVRVLSGYIMKDKEAIDVELTNPSKNSWQVQIDCLNPGEWIQVCYYFTGNVRAPVEVNGRVYGQDEKFDRTFDEENLSPAHRIAMLVGILLFVSSFASLFVSIFFIVRDYSFAQLIAECKHEVPDWLMGAFGFGVMIPSIIIVAVIMDHFEKRKHPKSYPIRYSKQPSQLDSFRAQYQAFAKGKTLGFSNSLYDFNKIVPKVDRTTEKPEGD